MVSNDELVATAREAQQRAFTGVNVENASYGLSVCAERNAVARAVLEGAREFTALAVVTNSDEPTMPCGVCRQVLWEFSHDLRVIVEGRTGRRVETTIRELFPLPFTSID
jgi:cytidine deaminase